MIQTLAERFAIAKGAPLNVDGEVVVNMYRRTVNDGQKVAVRVLKRIEHPVQGLRIKLSEGTIRVNEQDLKEAVIWLDTAPHEFELLCNTKKGATSELRVWNCWQDANGVTQAWIGNAGIVADETDSRVVLKCSSGTGAFDPRHLEAELRFE